jgi:hypothetical protein
MASTNGTADVDMETAKALARQLVDAAFAPKLQSRHLQNHHGAERLYIDRCRLGLWSGLGESQLKNIVPYPAPSSNTVIVNDTAQLVDLIERLVGTKQPVGQSDTAAESKDQPQVEPAAESKDQPQVEPAAEQAGWSFWHNRRKWLWPLLVSAGLAGGGGLTYYFWPTAADEPVGSEVEADLGVSFL